MYQKSSKWLFRFTRRSFLSLWLSTSLMSLVPKFSYSQKSEVIPEDIVVQFQNWSHVATGFSDITLNETRDYLEFCLQNGVTLTDISKLERSLYKGTLLEKRLLEGWMTGLVHLHGTKVDRHYDTMLMWKACGLDVKPLSCQNELRIWSVAPLGQ